MTYYVSKGQQIVRQAQNNSNYGESASRTESQQSNRVKWANIVNFYKASAGWMKKAFEAKKKGQTDYNKLMSVNLGTANIFLTRDEAEAGCCIIAPFIVSQGSLPSISIVQSGNVWKTDINLGALVLGADTSVADFSQAVITNNKTWRELDQLSFISYQQNVDAFGRPRAICTAYEVTLSLTDDRSLRSFLPDFCSSQTSDGYLATNDNISLGGFTYVQSRNASNSRLQVSSQQLVNNNSEMIAQYSSAEQLAAAIRSYGLSGTSFLDSGSEQTQATPQPQFIEYVKNEAINVLFPAGFRKPQIGAMFEDGPLTVKFALPVEIGDIMLVRLKAYRPSDLTGSPFNYDALAGSYSVEGNYLTINKGSQWNNDYVVAQLLVVIGGLSYVVDYSLQ